MALNRRHIAMCGSFNNGEKKALLDTFEEVSAGTIVPTAGPADLTDSTGGTPGATLAAITAGAAYAQADMTAVKNAIASLNAQIVALEDALQTSGVLT